MASDGRPTLGDFLRQEREKRGITLEQVASATKIGIRLLHSLEADQYVELPAKPFIRGFVTSYVRFIGLDPKEVLTNFGDFIDERAHDRPSREEGLSGYAFEKREGEQSRTFLWIVMGSFLVVGGLVFFFLKPSLHRHRGAHVEKLRSAHNVAKEASPVPVVPSPSAAPSPAIAMPAMPLVLAPAPLSQPSPRATKAPERQPTPSPSPAKAAEQEKPAKEDPLSSGLDIPKDEIKHKLVVRALEDVWVRYQVDGKKMMRFILRKDKILVLRGRDLLRFQASNPKAVRFNYNGSAAKVLADEKTAVMKKGDLTFIAPHQEAGKIEDPFPGTKVIQGAAVPSSPAPQTTSTPTP